MSRHVHFDLVGGMAGDMTLAALLDAGADHGQLVARLRASGLPFTDLVVERRWRGGLAGMCVDVAVERQAPSRTWEHIRGLIERCEVSSRARDLALDIFGRLARAEAETHGCDEEQVHFHEVGAMDSIVDIVGTAIALDLLDATSFSCSAVPVCQGSVTTEHGVLPLPAPATARLLVGFELYTIPGSLETITPTGAAILAALCQGSTRLAPPARLLAVGTGMGTAELADRPNVLRVLVSQPVSHDAAGRRPDAIVIEASIDDMDPRLYAEVSAHLFEAGALDVALLPLQMKKQRPGTLLQVVARPELEGVLSGIVLRETTSLGVRSHDVRRVELDRRHDTITTRFGDVRIKRGLLGDECLNAAPEYDDCVALARRHGVPVKEVLAAAIAAADAPAGQRRS